MLFKIDRKTGCFDCLGHINNLFETGDTKGYIFS